MNQRFSTKISNLSWICALMVVVIHGGTYASNLPGQEFQTVYGMNVPTFLQLFFTEGVCRVAVPLFFLISGYLYFRNFQPTMKWHCDKLKKRLRTNGIPYLFWGIMVLVFFFVAQKIPATAPYFSSESRDFSKFDRCKWLEVIFINPMNSPLWFLRDLILLALLSPVISLLCRRLRWIWIVLLFAAWILPINVRLCVIRWDSLLFFNAGALFSLRHHDCVERKWQSNKIATMLFVVWMLLVTAKTYYLCGLDAEILQEGKYDLLLDIFSKVNILLGIITVWAIYDALTTDETKPLRFVQFGFLMYVMHHPIIGIAKKLLLKVLGISYTTVTVAFFAAIFVTIIGVILFGICFKQLLPKLYSVLTGGR